ncbi:unnamed protein product [Caenorhabditis bovis]|uniref:Uncharacterized protein n=1 Tax=Caenorhabditis bovis TaxID=2654633 RepID=A0A8S1EWM5_9PELO|nr:unnamed protein product [Caenorhabditis bovis]
MSSRLLSILLVLLVAVATVENAVINRDRRAIQDYFYSGYGSNDVIHNVVSDNLVGGPTNLGWAQVPHVYSPMFSPVFGR